MTGQEVIELMGLDRAKSVHSKDESLLESESVILKEVNEKEFGVDFVYFNTDENENSFPAIFLKKVNSFDNLTLEKIANTHQKIWNYKKVLFLYVYSDTEIRIYNCSEKPIIKTEDDFDYDKELKNIEIESYTFSDKKQLEELNKLFSRIAIDTGIIWTLEEVSSIRLKINLQRRVDKYLVSSLVNTASKLKDDGLKLDVIHKVILRSLFLLYLEDRGAADKKFYCQFLDGAESYFDILNDVDATYDLYKRLKEHFNGNVFTLDPNEEKLNKEQLQNIKTCFIRGREKNDTQQLFEDWRIFRLFNFKIIQIELLSEIYENFLSVTDPTLKEDSGTYYTPPSLVEFILNEKLPVNKKEYNVKILDPSCGSGIFLVESFNRLVKRYENAYQLNKLSDFNVLVKLLKDNIFGIEIHPQAIKVAAFSLYLALVDKLDPKDLWQDKNHRLPYLINDPEEKNLQKQGYNLFLRDTISDLSKENLLQNFKLVVGNPPFGKLISEDKDIDGKQKDIRTYCNKEGFAKEMVLPFLHKATTFAPNGEIALIFNTKVLTNTGGTFQKFRYWLFNKCYVEKVYNFSILRNVPESFGGQLFGDATGPISIVFYQKEQPKNPNDKIAYYAPKTFIKSNVIDGLSIDFTDLKYLPREECQKSDTKIWKVAMWGGMNDWILINKINEKFDKSIGEFLEDNKDKYHFGSGLHSPSDKQIIKNKVFVPNHVINLRKVQRFYTLESANVPSVKIFRNVNKNIFKPPYIIIKEGQKEKEYCSSYIDYESYHTGAFSISVIDKNDDLSLKLICSLINSSFAKYYLSLTSASWGIERERVQSNETLILPLPLLINIDKRQTRSLEEKFDQLVAMIKSDFNYINAKTLESEIDNVILEKILRLSEHEKWMIKDIVDFSIDLLDKKETSDALKSVLPKQTTEYSKTISSEINDFLEGQELFANATVYCNINRFTPLMMIKLSFSKKEKEIETSEELVDVELKKIDQHLWEEKATNIYFRKKLNYKTGDDIYIIRPNQRRFWSHSMALEDASELILEILSGN